MTRKRVSILISEMVKVKTKGNAMEMTTISENLFLRSVK